MASLNENEISNLDPNPNYNGRGYRSGKSGGRQVELGNRYLEDAEALLSSNCEIRHTTRPITARLYRALIVGSLDDFENEISAHSPPITRLSELVCPKGNTVLHVAAAVGKELVIPSILNQDTDLLLARNERGDLAFHVASRSGHLGALQQLIHFALNFQSNSGNDRSGSEPNNVPSSTVMGNNVIIKDAIDKEQNTPLHIALENHQYAIAKYLVDTLPQLSCSPNFRGVTPLYLAIKAEYWDLVKIITTHSVSEEMAHQVRNRMNKYSVVHAAIMAENKDALADILTSNKALIDSLDEEGQTPLSYAAYLGYIDGIDYLLKKFPDQLFQPDDDGSFPIHSASRGGRINVVKKFIDLSDQMTHLLNGDGQNVLHVAAANGNSKLMAHLIKLTKRDTREINLKDHDGNTPLHLATMMKHPKVVYTLTRDNRVNIAAKNKVGLAPLDYALEYDRQPLYEEVNTLSRDNSFNSGAVNEAVLASLGCALQYDKQPSYEERLTWLTLTLAGAKNAPDPPIMVKPLARRNKHKMTDEKPNLDRYKDRVNTLLLVATLVATVTFAAGFTVPGGYLQSEPNEGLAVFFRKAAFQAFLITNTVAMYSSILVAIILMWAQLEDLKLIIVSLRFAVPLLGLALTMMSVTFMVGIHVVVSDLAWLAILVLVMGSLFWAVLLVLFIPLYSPTSTQSKILRKFFYNISLPMMLRIVSKCDS